MQEAVSLLRDKAAKAELKVQRAEKALETARTELSDLQTALRVMESLTGEGSGGSSATGPSAAVAERQAEIIKLLGVGSKQGHSPADLFSSYEAVSKERITIETFRTTVWRMKDKEFGDWVVRGDDGAYWKELTPFAVLDQELSAPAQAVQETEDESHFDPWADEDDDPHSVVGPTPRTYTVDDDIEF